MEFRSDSQKELEIIRSIFSSKQEPLSREEIVELVQESSESEGLEKIVDEILSSLVKNEEICCQTFPQYKVKIYWIKDFGSVQKIEKKSHPKKPLL